MALELLSSITVKSSFFAATLVVGCCLCSGRYAVHFYKVSDLSPTTNGATNVSEEHDAKVVRNDNKLVSSDTVRGKVIGRAKVKYCWVEMNPRDDSPMDICTSLEEFNRRQSIEGDKYQMMNRQEVVLPVSTRSVHGVRVGRSPYAVVDRMVNHRLKTNDVVTQQGHDAAFLNKDNGHDRSLPYGDERRVDSRIPNTRCDWLVIVDDCVGICQLVSPGYPGVYPYNVHCSYLVTSFEDSRVELKTASKELAGKFDIRSSQQCSEDYLAIYDGLSVNDPLIGKFCGQSMPHIVSNGPGLYVVFHAASRRPPVQRNKHVGFHLHAVARWRHHHEGGRRIVGTVCDWTFSSLNTVKGELHTPDSVLYNDTSCRYDFYGIDDNDRVELQIIAHQQPLLNSATDSTASVSCDETLTIYDGQSTESNTSTHFICIINDKLSHSDIGTTSVDERRIPFGFNSTGNRIQVVYRKPIGQLSNPDPTWIYFRFWRTRFAAGSRRDVIVKYTVSEAKLNLHGGNNPHSTTSEYTVTSLPSSSSSSSSSSSPHSMISMFIPFSSSSSSLCCVVKPHVCVLVLLFVAKFALFTQQR